MGVMRLIGGGEREGGDIAYFLLELLLELLLDRYAGGPKVCHASGGDGNVAFRPGVWHVLFQCYYYYIINVFKTSWVLS